MALLVAPFLVAVVIGLCFVNFLRNLYQARRSISITTTTLRAGGTVERRIRSYPQPPGPTPWPVLGNLITLGQYEVPFVGLTEMAKTYGDCYSLTLGSTRCLVVNNLELIREVLNQNGKFFGGRPDFLRFHTLFGGDRANSLALCDWSNLQQKRRNLARKHCSPRDSSSYYAKMSDIGCVEMDHFMSEIRRTMTPGQDCHIKPLIQQTCANMFSQYMCSTRFAYDDKDFQNITKCFDDIFWEINQGYAVDFLPWLAPFYAGHMKQIVSWSTEIRRFILDRIVGDRELHLDTDEPEKDFTDALLRSLIEDPDVQRDTIIYMLEDFLGGHSAIGNLVMVSLGYIARNAEIGRRIQAEVDATTDNGSRQVTLFDTDRMPYTLATIFEVLRHSSSPIVPHVATEDACISGYGITKGTLVFINNYELNTSDKYWDEPEVFRPERFLETVSLLDDESTAATEHSIDSGVESDHSGSQESVNHCVDAAAAAAAAAADEVRMKCNSSISDVAKTKVQIRKNIPHFLPFSIGKRTCIGQNLVKGFSFIMLANLLQSYDIGISDTNLIKMYPACVAVPAETYPLSFTVRKV